MMKQKQMKKELLLRNNTYHQKKDNELLMNQGQYNIIMEYQKITNLLDNASNQPSKFKTKKQVEIDDESRGVYNFNSQIKFENTILKSSLCDYSDA